MAGRYQGLRIATSTGKVMRINLKCPYQERRDAKLLGARWDGAKRVWYIEGVEDITPFMRWIESGPQSSRPARYVKPAKDRHAPRTTGAYKPLCDCDAIPWEDCDHTEYLAAQAMRDMLSMG